jgi:hypothetical protein
MSFQDATLSFNTNWTTPQAVTATADSTCIVDLTGATQGKAPGFSPGVLPNIINGFPATNTAVGFDPGTGDGIAIPYLYVTCTTAGGTSNTLTVSLKAAPDDGTGKEGTYTTLYTSAAITASTIAKGATLLVPVPPTLFNWGTAEALPRFLKVTYTAGGGNITGSFLAGIMLNPPSTLLLGQNNSNFIVV